MLPPELLNPKSILIVGGSNSLDHLGGSVLKNLLDQPFGGQLFVLNPRRETVQGVRSFKSATDAPPVDLAIFAIPAHDIYPAMKTLIEEKGVRAFIVYSAGFSELNEEGRKMEKKLLGLVENHGAWLLGPNNIGLLNRNFAGIFTKPIPKLDAGGVDFVSGSGATAVFTLEAAHRTGLTFNSLFTVGNSAQIGIEEVLEHWDQTYDQETSSRVKMLYMETIRKPYKFLKHSVSLQSKGCRLVALKSGSTEKGSAAAASHTGAMATSDLFVQALLDKAGVIRCHSRYALITIASLLQLSPNTVSKFAVITHAGGPGVILTDHLERNGLDVPTLTQSQQAYLRKLLNPGAAVSNPIDLLATGNAEQLEAVIRYCDQEVDEVDGIVVIFGSPGLGSVREAYEVIHESILSSTKPIFPVLPSVVNLEQEIEEFVAKGHIAFFDESLLGRGLGKIASAPHHSANLHTVESGLEEQIEKVVANEPSGFLSPEKAFELLEIAGISTLRPHLLQLDEKLTSCPAGMNFPLVMKATGILHKSDKNAVALNLNSIEELQETQKRLSAIPGATGVLVQQMKRGIEVYIGAKRVEGFPPLIVFGAGGIFVEVLQDIRYALAPINKEEALLQIKGLSSYQILKGARGQKGIDLDQFAEAVVAISQLVQALPEIQELDINPLMAASEGLFAADVRIKLSGRPAQ